MVLNVSINKVDKKVDGTKDDLVPRQLFKNYIYYMLSLSKQIILATNFMCEHLTKIKITENENWRSFSRFENIYSVILYVKIHFTLYEDKQILNILFYD